MWDHDLQSDWWTKSTSYRYLAVKGDRNDYVMDSKGHMQHNPLVNVKRRLGLMCNSRKT